MLENQVNSRLNINLAIFFKNCESENSKGKAYKFSDIESAIAAIKGALSHAHDAHGCASAISTVSIYLKHTDRRVRNYAAAALVQLIERIEEKISTMIFWDKLMFGRTNLKFLKFIINTVLKAINELNKETMNGNIDVSSIDLISINSVKNSLKNIYKNESKDDKRISHIQDLFMYEIFGDKTKPRPKLDNSKADEIQDAD